MWTTEVQEEVQHCAKSVSSHIVILRILNKYCIPNCKRTLSCIGIHTGSSPNFSKDLFKVFRDGELRA